ncbi:hypothetical protein [Leptolyngbya sp. FACHB-17]|uniref:hypothetical protein n=1 Tax=unclassified Leptolyngbya TaxID=2650499 RepID=UPI001680C1EB|nr:hypothetical protein [Leptolyngbya sp. FACHB-17]MBD2079687.1 hypothetical protein [Leptolyngbya sp. FACHB-17]
MGMFDRISRIARAEVNSRRSQPSHNVNLQTRELEQQADSLRRQIVDLETTAKNSMSGALRHEYGTTISSLKRSLATLEQAILDLGGTVDSKSVSVDDSELKATNVNFGASQNSIKTHSSSVADIDAELEELKRSLDEL